MLPKKNRADKKALNKIFAEGKFLNSPNLTFKYALNTPGIPRVSFVVPKNIARLAVKRNALRRAGYTALAKHINRLPSGLIGAFIFKKQQSNVLALENEIKTILNKIN